MKEYFNRHGVFSWNELMTTDLDAARSYYEALFGWTFQEMPMSDGGTYVIAKKDNDELAGLFLKPKETPEHIPPHWGSYITVDDVDATARKAQENGGTIIYPLTDIPEVGRFCVIQDPQGAVFSIITYVNCAG